METKRIKLKTVIVSACSVILLDLIVAPLFPKGIFLPIVLLGIIRMGEIFLFLVIVLKIENSLSSIGLAKETIIPGIKRGTIWAVSFGFIATVAFLIMFFTGIDPMELIVSPVPQDQIELICFFLVGGIIGPVAEEIFFRGIIYGFLRRYGIVTAILLSTAVFAAFHLFGGGIPVTQIIGGLLFALSYEMEKSLVVPMVIHISGNLAIFLLG